MKRVFALVGLSFAFLCSCSDKNKNKDVATDKEPVEKAVVAKSAPVKFNPKQSDWNEEKLVGKVKSIKDSTYDAIDRPDGPEKAELTIAHRLFYDQNGFNTEHHTVLINNPYGTGHNYLFTYKYDDIGNMVEKDEYNTDISKDIISGKVIYKYDDKANRVEESTYRATTLEDKSYYTYDEKGNRIEESRYMGDGRLLWKNRFKYDDKGNAIMSNGETGKNLYKYDEKGNQIEYRAYGVSGLISIDTYKYQFDKTGNWVQQIVIHETPWEHGKKIEIIAREIDYYP